VESINPIIESEVGEDREKISDEELGNLISSLGNNEAKALTLAIMKKNIVYSASDLRHALIDIQGKPPAWQIGGRTAFDYCIWSLAPIGLVAREVQDPGKDTYGYVKTRYGEQMGDSLSGLLQFRDEN
jgi:hypothetical protein